MKRIRRLFSKIFDFRPACRRAKSDVDSRSFGDVNLLFYTCVNEKYFEFALLYPIFVLCSNPGAVVEIGISNMKKFYKNTLTWSIFIKKLILPGFCSARCPAAVFFPIRSALSRSRF